MSRIVYRLSNATKKEIYIGTTKQTVVERIYDHIFGETDAIKHWDWLYDNIRPEIIKQNLSPQEAIELAHELEKGTPPVGWKIIQTGGM